MAEQQIDKTQQPLSQSPEFQKQVIQQKAEAKADNASKGEVGDKIYDPRLDKNAIIKPARPEDSYVVQYKGDNENTSQKSSNLSSPISKNTASFTPATPAAQPTTSAPKPAPAGIAGQASNYGYKPPSLTAGLSGSVLDVPNPSAMSGIGVQSTIGNLAQPLQAGLMKGLPQTNYSFGLPSLDMNNI